MKVLQLFFVISVLLMSSCSGPESPEFKKLENVKVVSASLQKMSITLSGDAVLFNPNPVGAKVSAMDFDVYANEKKVTNIKQNVTASISGNSEFKLPLEFDIPIKDVIEDFKPTLSDVFNKKELKYKIQGNLIVNLAGAKIKIPVEYEDTEEIKFLDAGINIPGINFGK